ADADVPGVVILVGDTVGENGAGTGAVEGVRGTEPLPTEFTRHIHAHAGGTEGCAGRRVLGGQRSVVAPGTRVQEVRRVILGRADRKAVVDGVVHLAVDFDEADVLLHDVAVGEEDRGRADAADVAAGNAAGEHVVGAAAARIQVAPDTDVEGEGAEGRADTAVDIHFS